MRRRRTVAVVALVGAAVVGSVTTIAVWGGRSTSTPTGPMRVATAKIVRTNLTTTVLTEGSLGYESTNPVINQLAGTYTAVPAPGTTIEPGQSLYSVDNQPVILMSGTIPAWRTFSPGMTDGPDVAELETDLIALSDANGLFSTADDHFSSLTAVAVSRWQITNGYPPSGQVTLGEVVFQSGPVLVGAANVAPGQPASRGDQPYQVTTTTRSVSVPLSPNLPPVTVGEAVSIALPSGATTPGRVSALAPASNTAGSGGQAATTGSAGSSSSSGSDQSSASMVATVTLLDPAAAGTGSGIAVQVSLTSQSAANVLAAPIAALLALEGGGYGLEVITAAGHDRLVGVTTGIFTGSQVQVSGRGVDAGVTVAVAQ